MHIQEKLGQEDGEMSEMTLPSRHRIRNSNPGGLRPSTTVHVHERKSGHLNIAID